MITIKSKSEIELMREVCKLTGLMYKELEKHIKPGISTYELDKIAENFMRAHGALPAQKGYNPGIKGVPPFPCSICTSINDEVIHGIPSKRAILKEGDVLKIDTVLLKNGFNGDAARTFIVGKPKSKEDERLVEITKQAFFEGIKYARKGNRIGDISHAIGEYVKSQGYSVVREFEGHGIGKEMHEEPQIPNFKPIGRGMKLRAGMTFAVEPMINRGKKEIWILEDGWTCDTRDGMNSAHYENTLLITEGEPELLSYNKDLV